MRISIAQMPPNPRDTPPFEMALTTAVLRRAGHEVAVFDVNNELYHQTYKQRPHWKFRLTDHSVEPQAAIFEAEKDKFVFYARRMLEGRPDAVVLKSENAMPNALEMGRILKSLSSEVVVIVSGSNTPDKAVLARWRRQQHGVEDYAATDLYDYHILGEDDIALPALLAAVDSGSMEELAGRFCIFGPVIDATAGPHVDDLDELPFYDFTDYDFMRYGDPVAIRYSASRSCTQHCAFCQDWVVGRKFRTMSGERWFEEYRAQNERHPQIGHFQMYDRLLNGDIGVLDAYCDRLLSYYGAKIERHGRPPVVWAGDFIIRPEMTDSLIAKMAKAQCVCLGTGLESGSERVRASIFKDFFSNDVAARMFESCRRHGILVSANIMIGLPTETRADFEESIRFVEANAANIWEIRLTAPTALVPTGTPLHNAPARFGLKDVDHEKWEAKDGNDYAERVRRFQEFCERALNLSQTTRLAVNRRIIKNAVGVRRLVEECRSGIPASV